MWRMLFFFMGVPMMIMSLFEAIDVLPYATDFNVLVDGKQIEMTVEQKTDLKGQVEKLFENCHTMPAFGVVTPKIYEEQIKDGIFVSIKFDQTYMLNELPFDELVFGVGKDFYGFNLMRGNKGVFDGRCVYMSVVDGNMDELYNSLSALTSGEEESNEIEQGEIVTKGEEGEEEKISD